MPTRTRKILVIDDDRDMLLLTRMILEDAYPDILFTTASDGPAGLAILDREPVDLVLCDYRMPRMDGLEVLHKAAQRRPEARRILMTAFSDPQIERKALRDSRVDYFLRKAVSPRELLATVALALQPNGEFEVLPLP